MKRLDFRIRIFPGRLTQRINNQWILDDSASALDYATDAALRKALAALPGSLTVFIVSQRAASLQYADQILVLDDGHLVGIGTHDQLRQTCPVYEEIYESQFKKGDAQK